MERKEYGKDKEKRKSDEKSLASNSVKSTSHSSVKTRPMDTNASSGNKTKLEKNIPLEKEPEGYLNDKKFRDSVQKTESTAKKKEYENVKNYYKDSRRNESLSREGIKKSTDECRSENKDKERRDVLKKGNQPNVKPKESKEKVKTTMSDLKKEDCRKTAREEKRGSETNFKVVNYNNGQLKKETEPIQEAKCKQPTAQLKLEEETPNIKIETDTKRKEKAAPKGMLIRNLLRAKADFADSKPKLYESDDDSHHVTVKSEDRKVKEDLAHPSEYESPNTKSVNIQNESGLDHTGPQTETKSKKSKSSRKEKSKKKSKKRDKDSLDERNDDIIKSKKKKRKDKEKKSGKKQKTYEDEKTCSTTIHNEGADKQVLSLVATKLAPKSSLSNKPAHKKCVFTSDGSDSDGLTSTHADQHTDKNRRSDIKERLLPDIQSRPPELVSPLSSSSSISSPVRHRRSSSNSSSSSSTPRSVIKTPSPLPTNHPTHISTSSEDEKPHVTPHKPSTILTKARKSLDKVKKSHTVRKSPYISDSDSDMETKNEKSKIKINKVTS